MTIIANGNNCNDANAYMAAIWMLMMLLVDIMTLVTHRLLINPHCPLALALFDISISDIDCRYIDTFQKYRYRYQYRYGHF